MAIIIKTNNIKDEQNNRGGCSDPQICITTERTHTNQDTSDHLLLYGNVASETLYT